MVRCICCDHTFNPEDMRVLGEVHICVFCLPPEKGKLEPFCTAQAHFND